jgi:predicted phage terminase large subunit-like protein
VSLSCWTPERVERARRGLTPAEAAELDRLLAWSREEEAPGYLSWLRNSIPKTWTVDAPHIRLIAEHLDAVTRGEIDRLAIHMPPRHGKTEQVTVRYPLYRLERDREMNVLVTGYNAAFARKLGRKTRNLALERGLVAKDKAAADEWALREGGLFMTRGVGSPPTGTGFGLILVDDPIRRREDADSEVYREKVWDWYTDDLYTRLEPGGALVLVMTLWHEDDIGARAVASEPGRWTVLKLPALAEGPDEMGRAAGDPLWPDRYPASALERIRSVLVQNEGERSWQALYQQNPTPKEGTLFKVGQLKVVDAVPAGMQSVRGWDKAATEGAGDYTAGVRMSGPDEDGRYYVVDVVRERWDTAERDKQIRLTAEMDGRGVRVRGPQDPAAAGKSDAAAFVKLLAGFDVRTEPVSGSKELRAGPLSAQVNAGNVRLLRGDWNQAFVEELRSFPQGKFDDQVDAAADAFLELTRGAVIESDAALHAAFFNRDLS